jgi:hypothetical protein
MQSVVDQNQVERLIGEREPLDVGHHGSDVEVAPPSALARSNCGAVADVRGDHLRSGMCQELRVHPGAPADGQDRHAGQRSDRGGGTAELLSQEEAVELRGSVRPRDLELGCRRPIGVGGLRSFVR